MTDPLEQARAIGREHGKNAADWWEQDAIGGRVTGDVRPTARLVLEGIEEGDPAVLDGLPRPDLSGQYADGYTPAKLLAEVGGGEVQDLCDVYEAEFEVACQGAVVAHCKRVLEVEV